MVERSDTERMAIRDFECAYFEHMRDPTVIKEPVKPLHRRKELSHGQDHTPHHWKTGRRGE